MDTSTACTTVTFRLATRLAGRELILTLTLRQKLLQKIFTKKYLGTIGNYLTCMGWSGMYSLLSSPTSSVRDPSVMWMQMMDTRWISGLYPPLKRLSLDTAMTGRMVSMGGKTSRSQNTICTILLLSSGS